MLGQEEVGRGLRGLIAAALLVALLAAIPAAAHSATPANGSARIDTSFGRSGRAAIGFGFAGSQKEYGSAAGWENSAVEMLPGPGAASLIVGRHQIVGLLSNGSVDTSFGEGGRLTPSSLEGLAFEIAAVAFDSQGRLLVFGTGEELGVTKLLPGYMPAYVHPSSAMVARYTPGGTLDPSFGGGDGVARSDFGVRGNLTVSGGGPVPPLIRVVAGGVDGQDRPIVVANTTEVRQGPIRSRYAPSAPFAARFTASGDLETGFAGGKGIAQLPDEREVSVAVAKSGSILVSGTVFIGPEENEKSFTRITQLTPEGTIDSSFGANGSQLVVTSNGPIIDVKGRLLLLQHPAEGRHQQVLRLLADGQVDEKFGHGGRAGLKLPASTAVSSLAVDEQGRILVAGASQQVKVPGQPYPYETQVYGRQLLLGRLLSSGARDRQFGKEGWLRTGMGQETKLAFPGKGVADEQSDQIGPQAELDSSGRLVVVDPGQSPKLPDGGLFLARYKLGG